MLTPPQEKLLRAAQASGSPIEVRGSKLRVARVLASYGYGDVIVGGSGVAYQGTWWWEFRLNERGFALPPLPRR